MYVYNFALRTNFDTPSW